MSDVHPLVLARYDTVLAPHRLITEPAETRYKLTVFVQRGGTLYTLTVLCREADWPKRERTLREVARSFRLTS